MVDLVPVDHDPFAIDPAVMAKPGQQIAPPIDPWQSAQQVSQAAVTSMRPYWMDLEPTDREILERSNAMQTGQTQPGKVLPTTGMNPVPFAAMDIASMLPVGGLSKLAAAAMGMGAKRALTGAAEAGAGAVERGIAQQAAEAAQPGIRAYHGSPYDFNQFDISKIGTGEGAQAYGHGLYFAENPTVAEEYKKKLAAAINRRPATLATTGPFAGAQGLEADPARPGRMYEVNIAAHPDQFLDWDKPLSEQPQHIKDMLPLDEKGRAVLPNGERTDPGQLRGQHLYRAFTEAKSGDVSIATSELHQAGIPGIKYLDQGSRGAGNGTRNYVIFDPKIIDIVKKYGIAGLGAFPAGAHMLEQVDGDPFKPGMASGGRVWGKKLSHKAVGYVTKSRVPGKHCSVCTMFRDGPHCTLVKDPIDPGGLCRRFDRRK